MAHRTLKWWISSGMAAAVILALSGCGDGAGGGEQVASAGGQENAADPGEPADAPPLDEDEQALVFAVCMRENGIDMPDPAPGQQGLAAAFESVAGDYDRATIEQALAACQDLIPRFGSQGAHGTDEWRLAVAECLREQGLDVSDNPMADIHGGELDPDELAAAMEVCRNVVNGSDQ